MKINPYQPPDSTSNSEWEIGIPVSAYVFTALSFLTVFLLVGFSFDFILRGIGPSFVAMQLMNFASISGYLVGAAFGSIVGWMTWRRSMRAHNSRVDFVTKRRALLEEYGAERNP